MLLKSGINLSNTLIEFIENCDSLYIFVPYIKLETLKILLQNQKNCKAIIVRWEPKDLILGVSDLDIYNYCKEKNITLYRNPRIHLKVFIEPYTKCVIGSANISARALNIPQSLYHNYEVASISNKLTLEDKLYFEKIISESLLITDSIYKQIKEQLPLKSILTTNDDDFTLKIEAPDKDFLISSLPMSYSVDRLYELYVNHLSYSESDEVNCMIHDIALYNIPIGLPKNDFIALLKGNFFSHPFIKAFLLKVKDEGFIYFGRANEWIISHCTNVPLPRRWGTKVNIQILFRWIVELGEGIYQEDRPNYSQRLYIVSKSE